MPSFEWSVEGECPKCDAPYAAEGLIHDTGEFEPEFVDAKCSCSGLADHAYDSTDKDDYIEARRDAYEAHQDEKLHILRDGG